MISTPLFKKGHPLSYVGQDRAITVVDSAVAEHSLLKEKVAGLQVLPGICASSFIRSTGGKVLHSCNHEPLLKESEKS